MKCAQDFCFKEKETAVLIVSWNVNSIRQRLVPLLSFLREKTPDIVCLQELKCEESAFPHSEIEDAGYNALVQGQKTFNGVAILSRRPIQESIVGLPGFDEDVQSRYVEAVISDGQSGVIRVASIYAPNGNPVDSAKYPYKLAFMAALEHHAQDLLQQEEVTVLAGDYNIIPDARDVYDPSAWSKDALFLPSSRAAFQRLVNLGYSDALRCVTDEPERYTFWDYQAGAWQKNHGLRIDHFLLSPRAADLLARVKIIKSFRSGEKPSDHVPICVELSASKN